MEFLQVKDERVIRRVLNRRPAAADRAGSVREKGDLFVVIADIFRPCHALIGKKRGQARAIERHFRFNVLMAAIWPAHCHPTHTAVLAKERLHCFASNDVGTPLGGLVEHHAVEMTATNLPGCSRVSFQSDVRAETGMNQAFTPSDP